MADTKTGSGLGVVLVLAIVAGLGYEVVKHLPKDPFPGSHPSPVVTVDAAPVPVIVVPAPGKASAAPIPAPTQTRNILIMVATWTKAPPPIIYTVAGQAHQVQPQEQGPWQWSSRPYIVPVPGTDYLLQVGSTIGDYGIIRCHFERNGMIVGEPVEPRDTSTDPGAIRCRYREP